MLANILILSIAAIFSAYVIYSACRKYIGYNPQATSLWTRVKAWWPGFVKRHIVDDDPYQDEGHAATRYADDYVDWLSVPDGYDWVAVDEDRYISWFVRKPEISSYSNQWIVDRIDRLVDYDLAITPAFVIGSLPPWRDSLRHRPCK